MKTKPTTIVWFRLDLRIDDHRPLLHAVERGCVIPLFILDETSSDDPSTPSPRPIGGASKWWLHHSLNELSQTLERLGSPLILRSGDPTKILSELCETTGADQVAIHHAIEPNLDACDDRIDEALRSQGIELVRFAPDLLWTVGSIMTGDANPYKVFTPFWKQAIKNPVEEPVEAPKKIRPPNDIPDSESLKSLGLIDPIGWDSGIAQRWSPGESSARTSFEQFRKKLINTYHDTRNQLDEPGWSALSPHLHFGEISPRRIWNTLTTKHDLDSEEGPSAFARQLVWRDFASHLLNHFPETPNQPFRDQFKDFPWQTNPEHLKHWKQGTTGYPVVDAAMRQLWIEGWIPNRVRMVVASFLCKHLLISWKEGEAWFWDTLVDADLPNNVFGWQWTAGCGADAAPYFRIFNPMTQSKKFDPDGDYIRRWIPELAKLEGSSIHEPWEAKPLELSSAGITLGEDYPNPIVDHPTARQKALDAYEQVKG